MTKRELSQLFWLNREIALNKAKIAELEARAASTSAVLSDMPRGNLPGDKVGRLAAEIADERGIYLANLQCGRSCSCAMWRGSSGRRLPTGSGRMKMRLNRHTAGS